MTGQVSYLKGKSAESQVLKKYLAEGYGLLARRWRGPSGEIDLVFRDDDEVVFVEVKSGRSHARALAHLRPRQIARLLQSAEASLAYLCRGSLTPVRFDVAVVDGGGRIDVIPNALQAA
jgi:putative endonuclease